MTHDTLHSHSSRGQIAIGFFLLMAFTLLLVRMTVNVGQAAQVRVETSNAADAGALAAASWIASGQNEAAMIAIRMRDAMAMIQAIYLVPFCPGQEAQHYANRLWASLRADPGFVMFPGLPPVPGDENRGPNAYFAEVADAAMHSAWHVGSREAYTAVINNMMIRNNTGINGEDSGEYGPTPGANFGDLPGQIQSNQEQMYKDASTGGMVGSWNNGLPLDDPKQLTHKPYYQFQYSPMQPPTLQVRPIYANYYQYRDAEAVPAYPSPIFNCDFQGTGIRNTLEPVARLSNVTLPDNPLAVNPATGQKGWEQIDLKQVIPGIHDMDIGTCEAHVCGMEQVVTVPVQVLPEKIQNGAGDVTVTVEHEVITPGGTGVDHGFQFQIWNQRFPKVVSRAKAHYLEATILRAESTPFGNAGPTPEADAKLTDRR